MFSVGKANTVELAKFLLVWKIFLSALVHKALFVFFGYAQFRDRACPCQILATPWTHSVMEIELIVHQKLRGSPCGVEGECWTCNPKVSGSMPGSSNLKKLKIHGLPQNHNKEMNVRWLQLRLYRGLAKLPCLESCHDTSISSVTKKIKSAPNSCLTQISLTRGFKQSKSLQNK